MNKVKDVSEMSRAEFMEYKRARQAYRLERRKVKRMELIIDMSTLLGALVLIYLTACFFNVLMNNTYVGGANNMAWWNCFRQIGESMARNKVHTMIM